MEGSSFVSLASVTSISHPSFAGAGSGTAKPLCTSCSQAQRLGGGMENILSVRALHRSQIAH